MAVLCDFIRLEDTAPPAVPEGVVIGDATPDGWLSDPFDTGGRRASPAILMLQVRDLTHATAKAAVSVNGIIVGHIRPYRYRLEEDREANQLHWFTQYLTFDGALLKDGDGNRVLIQPVGFPGAVVPSANEKDDFRVREIVCWFHQAS